MKRQLKPTQGLKEGQKSARKLKASAARAVLASSMMERPMLRSANAYETQKVLFIACVSFLILFACTFFDVFALR